MKKVFAVLRIVVAVLVCAQPVMANGIFIPPGAKAASMGGAFVGVADDASSVFWNPAGLSQLDGSGVSLSTFYLSAKTQSNTSLANAESLAPNAYDGDFPVYDLYGILGNSAVEPSAYKETGFKTDALLPFLVGHARVKDMTLALGFYVSGGGGGKWEDSLPDGLGMGDTLTAKANGSMAFTVMNVALSKKVNDALSLGLALNRVTMMDKLKFTKEYTKSATSILNNYSILAEMDASGSGIEAILGCMYKPLPAMRLGLTVRSGASIKLKGSATSKTSGISTLTGTAIPDVNFESGYTKNYIYPFNYALGLSYDPKENLTLACEVDINKYSALRNEIDYATELAGTFADVNTDMQWKDTTQFKIGAEYRVKENTAFRAGYQTDPSPVDTGNLTVLDTFQYDLSILTLGIGQKMKSVTLDGAAAFASSNKPSKAGREYSYPFTYYHITLSYAF